jgi:hypothetical protein
LQRAEEVGAAKAARELGLSAATIRGWRHREGRSGPPAGVDPVDWGARKARGAEDSWAAAQQALAQVRVHLDAGKTGDAQRAALTMAILTDKAGLLEQAARRAQALRVEERAAQAVEALFGDLGVPFTDTLRRMLAFHSGDTPEGEAPGAETARAELRTHVNDGEGETTDDGRLADVASLLLEIGAVECPRCAGRGRDDEPPRLPPLLPAPRRAHPDGNDEQEGETMVGPKRIVRVLRERLNREREPEREPPEVVQGEVVVEASRPEAAQARLHGDDEQWRH